MLGLNGELICFLGQPLTHRHPVHPSPPSSTAAQSEDPDSTVKAGSAAVPVTPHDPRPRH
ncbi:hypothetical protein QJS66_19905 [Kocuria rhizophila]|nr:hypothetical protein QJS66_19905 [Kocuria rhizophila]